MGVGVGFFVGFGVAVGLGVAVGFDVGALVGCDSDTLSVVAIVGFKGGYVFGEVFLTEDCIYRGKAELARLHNLA